MINHRKVKYCFHLIAPGEAYRYELRSHREAKSCRESARRFSKRHSAKLQWKLGRNDRNITIWRSIAEPHLHLVA